MMTDVSRSQPSRATVWFITICLLCLSLTGCDTRYQESLALNPLKLKTDTEAHKKETENALKEVINEIATQFNMQVVPISDDERNGGCLAQYRRFDPTPGLRVGLLTIQGVTPIYRFYFDSFPASKESSLMKQIRLALTDKLIERFGTTPDFVELRQN